MGTRLRFWITFFVAATTAILLCWDRAYHSVVTLPAAPEAEQRRAVLIWVGSILAVLATSIGFGFVAFRRRPEPAWPFREVIGFGVVCAYVGAEIGWGWPLWPTSLGDYSIALVYAAGAVCFVTALEKLVAALSQRSWLKAAASFVVVAVTGSAVFCSSGMIIYFT